MRCNRFVIITAAFVAGVVSSNAVGPYDGIVDRNVFALKPPSAPGPVEPAKPVSGKIVLHGITSILGRWQVLGKLQVPGRPPEPAKDVPFILSEGQREGDVEVVSIDGKAGTVHLLNAGVAETLTMDKDGAKAAPAPSPVAAIPPPHQTFPAAPGSVSTSAANNASIIPRTIPTRNNRSQTENSGEPGMSGFSGGGINGISEQQQIAAQRSAEENVVRYEANRLKNEELRRSGVNLPRMPQHPLLGGGNHAEDPAAQ